jgi:hypothetical protein
MKHSAILCCVLALCGAQLVWAKLPPPSQAEQAKTIAARAKAAEAAKKEAAALARAQDRVAEFYKRSKSGAAVASDKHASGGGKSARKARRGAVERLACLTGNEDRHARIGVELIDHKVNSFAYYSKWKPRTCSIEVKRDGVYSRWEDHGTMSKVTLIEEKGIFVIDHKGGTYRFVFRDIDRGRYCGMDGKINGTLTVTRGKNHCGLQGVMDEHSG